MPPTLWLALEEHRRRMEPIRGRLTGDDLVFTCEDGRPMLPSAVSDAFTRIVRKIRLVGVRLHDLRHTHPSLMLSKAFAPR